MKKYGFYLLYALGFLLILYIEFAVYRHFRAIQDQYYKVFPGILYYSLSFLLTGLYLGLPLFIKNFSLEGHWSVNWPRLLFFGIPLLYLVLYPLIYFNGTSLTIPNMTFNLMFTQFIDIPPILFGYLVITSINKS